MPPDGFHHFIEWQLRKVFYNMRFANTGFHSQEVEGTFILQNIEINVVIVIFECIDG
jgi:hypothetical protein